MSRTAPPSSRALFLPGAGGSAGFWQPVAERLSRDVTPVMLRWPGLGDEPPEPGVTSIDDLVRRVLDQLEIGSPARPSDLVAQSLGGAVALRVALAAPGRVRRLVLTATSGGLPISDLRPHDWRPSYRETYPRAASWIGDYAEDLSGQIGTIIAPTLLIWGDRDPISPVGVGARLQKLLPNARLHVIAGADHDLGHRHADEVADLIRAHLAPDA